MSDLSSYDGPRSYRRKNPNALQRLPSTNSSELKEMWKDVANARPKEPSLPRENWGPLEGRGEGESQDRLLEPRRTQESRTSSRRSSAVGHLLARTDSDAPSWTSAQQHAHTNSETANYRQDRFEQAKPGPPVNTTERSRSFIPVARHRIKHVVRRVLRHVSTELGSTEEGRMAKRMQEYNSEERQEEHKRNEQRQAAFLRARARSSGSFNLDSE